MNPSILEKIENPDTATFDEDFQFRDSGSRVTSVLANTVVVARFWVAIAVIGWSAALAGPFIGFHLGQERYQVPVILLGEDETWHVAPFRTWDEARELHFTMAKNAARAILDRDFSGFGKERDEELERLFDNRPFGDESGALDKVYDLEKSEKTDFLAKRLHQFPKFHEVEILEQNKMLTIVRLNGQLVQVGKVGSSSFNEVKEFEITFWMVRNPNLITNGRYPTVVVNFKYASQDANK